MVVHEYTQDSAIKRKEKDFIELQYFAYINQFLMGYLNGQDGPVLISPALFFFFFWPIFSYLDIKVDQ